MQSHRSLASAVLFLVLGVFFIGQSYSTPLDDYVRAPDTHFGWTVIRTYEQPDYILYVLNFTSQKWLDGELRKVSIRSIRGFFSRLVETVTTNPIWWHYLCITVPHKLTRPDTAFMLIDGGSNNDG